VERRPLLPHIFHGEVEDLACGRITDWHTSLCCLRPEPPIACASTFAHEPVVLEVDAVVHAYRLRRDEISRDAIDRGAAMASWKPGQNASSPRAKHRQPPSRIQRNGIRDAQAFA